MPRAVTLVMSKYSLVLTLNNGKSSDLVSSPLFFIFGHDTCRLSEIFRSSTLFEFITCLSESPVIITYGEFTIGGIFAYD